MIWLAAILLVHPTLTDDGSLRVAATGVNDDVVVWSLDGVEVARTKDRQAATIPVEAGEHDLQASSKAPGRWQMMARLDGAAEGAAYVPAWTAVHEPASAPSVPNSQRQPPPLALGLAITAAALLLWPGRRGLEALRRRRRA